MITLCIAASIALGAGNCAKTDAFEEENSRANLVVGVNVLLKRPIDGAMRVDLGRHGQVLDEMPEINAVAMRAAVSEIPLIRSEACVLEASEDAPRYSAGSHLARIDDCAAGANLWNLDAINVTDFGGGRTVGYDGDGVFVAVLDTGLPHNWREYFPADRIAVNLARTFGGGGGEKGTVSSQPETWEHDTGGHGTMVASILLGYRYAGPQALPTVFNGVAPKTTIIPVRADKSRDGFAWTSVETSALLYLVNLKVSGALGNSRLVVNISWGGPDPDAIERAAIDYSIANGVIVVASAGNEGEVGMVYPAAYAPVISVAAAAWKKQFAYDDPTQIEWIMRDVAENDPGEYLVTGFSGRELPGQQLDVTAPGAAVPVALTLDGRVDYAYFSGTSAAAPHVAGVAALMLQKNPSLTQAQIESILRATAMPLPPGCNEVRVRFESHGRYPTWSDLRNLISFDATVCWGSNATGAGLVQANSALLATP